MSLEIFSLLSNSSTIVILGLMAIIVIIAIGLTLDELRT